MNFHLLKRTLTNLAQNKIVRLLAAHEKIGRTWTGNKNYKYAGSRPFYQNSKKRNHLHKRHDHELAEHNIHEKKKKQRNMSLLLTTICSSFNLSPHKAIMSQVCITEIELKLKTTESHSPSKPGRFVLLKPKQADNNTTAHAEAALMLSMVEIVYQAP